MSGLIVLPSIESLNFVVDICYNYNICNVEIQKLHDLWILYCFEELDFAFLRFVLLLNGIPCDCIAN